MSNNIHTRFDAETNDQLSELFRTWSLLDNYAESFSYENEAANGRAAKACEIYGVALDLASATKEAAALVPVIRQGLWVQFGQVEEVTL